MKRALLTASSITVLISSVLFGSRAFAGTIHCDGGDDGAFYEVAAATDTANQVTGFTFGYHDSDGFAFGRTLAKVTSRNVAGKSLDFTGTDDAGQVILHAALPVDSSARYLGAVTASGSSGESIEVDVACSLN